MPDQVDWRSMERDASPGRAVGRLLRDQRVAREFSIEDVASRLHIRVRYLEAIEQGRFDQLPGPAYIPAFLRAYATHVGLEPDKVLTAYHLSGAVPIARPVALPADFRVVEKRAPIGLAVLTILMLVGAGYAAWQYLPHHQALISQKVPPVPDRLLASPAPAPAVAPSAPAADQPVSPPVQEAQVAPAPVAPPVAPPPVAPSPVAPTTVAPTAAEIWPGPSPKPESPVAIAPPATPPSAAVSAPSPVAVPAPVAVAPPPAAPPAPPPVIVSAPPPPSVVMPMPAPGQAQAAQAPVVMPPPAPAAPAPQEAVARPAPEQNNPGMMPTPPMRADTLVQVRSNSWIELRSPEGEILAQTYVRAGESYTVPMGISYRVIDAR